jgi:hypothetical protein
LERNVMDLSQLKPLGEIAGIGGIALGAMTLLIRPLIGALLGLPKDERAGAVKLIAIGCFGIGALGIAAWIIGSQSTGSTVSTHGSQSPGIISKENATVTYGNTSGIPETPPATPVPPSSSAPTGDVRTEGNQSPSIISGGKVGVRYAPGLLSPASQPQGH